jgi:UDP-GlcNAc3NAcA epimerase
MKIATIVGARPQFIKAATLTRVFRKLPAVEEVMIHTGQHYDQNLSAVFFEQMGIPEPAFNLGIGSGSHGFQTGRMLEEIERTLQQVQPDYVLVYGDTNSTLAGALAAVKLHLHVAHVEAGLRSFNRAIPEEVNRILTDHTSDLLFAPTETALVNLQREGLADGRCYLTGDVMYDAALYYAPIAEAESRLLDSLQFGDRDYILATIHRPINTDNLSNLRTILAAFASVAKDIPVVFPMHPRTRQRLLRAGMLDEIPGGIRIIEPVGYLDIVMLEKHARLVATDSGGMQKEAFFYRVPCVTLREETEWTELVDLGWNRLAPPVSTAAVVTALRAALEAGPGSEAAPYGDGHSAERIAGILTQHDRGTSQAAAQIEEFVVAEAEKRS